jgi:phytoene synthase
VTVGATSAVMPPQLSPCAEIVRRHDPDRFLTALFAPPALRDTLFVLYAVNHELARAREVVTNPMAALIRLQWWREVAEGARRRHEVAGPLGEALDGGGLDAADLLAMIDGREAEIEPMETEAAFRDYLLAAAGGVAVAAGRALGAAGPALDALRDLGAAYGAAGVLRSVPALARQSRCVLPEDVLAQHGLSPEDVIADPERAGMEGVRTHIAAMASEWLAAGRACGLPKQAIAAALPAVLAARDLARTRYEARGLADRLAVAAAALRGRV